MMLEGDRNAGDTRYGFTLVEVTISLVVLVVLVGGAFALTSRAEDHLSAELQRLALDATGKRVLSRIREELSQADPATIAPSVLDGSGYIRYRKVTGYSGGAVQLGPENTLEFRLANDETLDGKDDNNDGIPDEGVVVHHDGSAESTIADNILSLSFTSTSGGVSFTVRVAAALRRHGIAERTFSQELSFRN